MIEDKQYTKEEYYKKMDEIMKKEWKIVIYSHIESIIFFITY